LAIKKYKAALTINERKGVIVILAKLLKYIKINSKSKLSFYRISENFLSNPQSKNVYLNLAFPENNSETSFLLYLMTNI
jgi:hypothetical protein